MTVEPVTAEYVAERLREAAETFRQMPVPRDGFPAGHRSTMPEPVISFWEMWNQLTAQERDERTRDFNRTRIKPSPQRVDRAFEAAQWLLTSGPWLDLRDRHCCWAVALGIPFRRISQTDGRSHEHIRRVWIGSCCAIASTLEKNRVDKCDKIRVSG